MSDYIKATNFTSKDTLPTGNAGKIVKGTEIDTEFTAIASAISSKADLYSPTLTGVPLAPTAAVGTASTQVATTLFVDNERTATATLTNKTLTSPTINTPTISTPSITGGTITGITDITVADGGTGASSITANSVVLGNGTSPLSGNLVAPGASAQVLTSNGTTWQSIAPAYIGAKAQVFTASGTFTVPTGVTAVKVTLCGGGGGGGGSSDSGIPAGNGGQGGTSSFGTYVSQTGGSGGSGANNYNPPVGEVNTGANFQTYDSLLNGAKTISYGGGGAGGVSSGASSPTDGEGGQSTRLAIAYITGLTPSSNITVNVGIGGTGGARGGYYPPNEQNGFVGTAGIVIVEW